MGQSYVTNCVKGDTKINAHHLLITIISINKCHRTIITIFMPQPSRASRDSKVYTTTCRMYRCQITILCPNENDRDCYSLVGSMNLRHGLWRLRWEHAVVPLQYCLPAALPTHFNLETKLFFYCFIDSFTGKSVSIGPADTFMPSFC